jgi:hypothetical protein
LRLWARSGSNCVSSARADAVRPARSRKFAQV